MGWRDKIRQTISNVANKIKSVIAPKSTPAPTRTTAAASGGITSGPNQNMSPANANMTSASTGNAARVAPTPSMSIGTNRNTPVQSLASGGVRTAGGGEMSPTPTSPSLMENIKQSLSNPVDTKNFFGNAAEGQTQTSMALPFSPNSISKEMIAMTGKAASGAANIAKQAFSKEKMIADAVAAAKGAGINARSFNFDKTGKLIGLTLKEETLMQSIFGSGTLMKTAMGIGAIAVVAKWWSDSVSQGAWAKKESSETPALWTRPFIQQARETGDWSIVQEAVETTDAALYRTDWEKLIDNTPFAPRQEALKGVDAQKKTQELVKRYISEEQQIQLDEENIIRAGIGVFGAPETEDTQAGTPVASKEPKLSPKQQAEDAMWDRRNAKQQAQIEENRAENEAMQIRMINFRNEARERGDRESAAFWDKRAAEQRALELEQQKAIIEYWKEYKKFIMKMQEEMGRSRLRFGIL